jgi:hypothetical protein
LSTSALVEMTATTIFRRATATTSKARRPNSKPLSSTSWPHIACSRLTKATRKFCFRTIHVKEPDQMAKSSTMSTYCHGEKSSLPIFPFWLAPPVPYSTFRLRV